MKENALKKTSHEDERVKTERVKKKNEKKHYTRVLEDLQAALAEKIDEAGNEERRYYEALEGSYTQGAAAVATLYLRKDAGVIRLAIKALEEGPKEAPLDPKCTQEAVENLLRLLDPKEEESLEILLHPVTRAAAGGAVMRMIEKSNWVLELMPPSSKTGLPAEDQIIVHFRGAMLSAYIPPRSGWNKSSRLLYSNFREKGSDAEGAKRLVEETTKPRTMK